MPIKFRCLHCRQYLGISRAKAGTVVDCPTCGRSVKVPQKDGRAERVAPPALNHEDSQLAQALNEVAQIARPQSAMPSPSSRRSNDARETKEVHEPPPVLVPNSPLLPAQRVDPPLERRVMPPLAAAMPIARPGTTGSEHDDQDEETLYSQAPTHQLADLTAEPPAGLAAERAIPNALPQTVSSLRDEFPWTNELPWKMWLAFAVVGLAAMITGFVLGRWDAQNQRPAASSAEPDDSNAAAVPLPRTNLDLVTNAAPTALKGLLQYKDGDTAKPDQRARIYVLPGTRSGTRKLSWEAMLADVTDSNHQMEAAALRALGGNVALANDEGKFAVPLPGQGTYHVVFVSQYVSRDVDDPIPSEVAELLDQYFDQPAKIVGRLQIKHETINYDGKEPVTEDHVF